MSQRSENPKLVALPPPAHQAIQEMTFMHSVAEYTAAETWRKEPEKINHDVPFNSHNRDPQNNESRALTHPKLEDPADQQLVLSRNFVLDVLVEAWFYFHDFRKWGKVVGAL